MISHRSLSNSFLTSLFKYSYDILRTLFQCFNTLFCWKPFFFFYLFLFATKCVLYLRTVSQPAFLIWNNPNSRPLSELHFLKHLSLISLLWTLPICFLPFLNCSTQIYKQPCSAAKSSYQLLSHWIKLDLITRNWYLAFLIQRPVTPAHKAYWRGKPFFHGLLTSGNMLVFSTNENCHRSPGTRWTKKRLKLLIPARNLDPVNIRKKSGKVHQFSTCSQKL